jgi:hypothetical protein
MPSTPAEAPTPASEPAEAPSTPAAPAARPEILDEYVREQPSPQLAVDLFKGEWSSALPEALGVEAGTVGLFADERITWLLDQTGGLAGRRVLELGPLEAGHTYQLVAAGAEVVAVEANTRAYLKCLIAKEILAMPRCRFLLGDFVAHLDAHQDQRYDLLLASGVLYHATDPLRLLELCAGVADQLAIWTHYYDAGPVESTPAIAQHFQAPTETVGFRGRTLTLHPRHYLESLAWNGFCGGPESFARWMERDDLLAVLDLLGYDDVRIGGDDPGHVNGPCTLLLARRTAR